MNKAAASAAQFPQCLSFHAYV